ncbi:hypothetical protein [Amycolatopsis sp. La24]|uniref:hypothetical protein n=1 Tax=Amycolatopsis sp. La24 TaxID=3028304 RepID=UPI0023B0D2B3|nr:hypothetical protein [Amycolatopsis sp. La24]
MGTGLLADWLLSAVVKIVTAYTRPGQRVLLLDPVLCFASSVSTSYTGSRNRSQPGPYSGPHEAAWTVVRLGRGVQTLTAFAPPGAADEHSDGPSARRSESGSGLDITRPAAVRSAGPAISDRPGLVLPETGSNPDRYDLIIGVVEPRAAGWFRPTDWADLLTQNGVLAVVTPSRRMSGVFADPAGPLVRAAHRTGLHYLDRIALLRVHVHPSTTATPNTLPRDVERPPAQHALAHDDLFVFTRQKPRTPAADQDGDLR